MTLHGGGLSGKTGGFGFPQVLFPKKGNILDGIFIKASSTFSERVLSSDIQGIHVRGCRFSKGRGFEGRSKEMLKFSIIVTQNDANPRQDIFFYPQKIRMNKVKDT